MPNELLGWDADFYNSLSDTTRNISLSDKEIYVLGNLLPMVSWATRWSGDISGLDLDAIRGEMEFTLLDEIEGGTMSCEDIADCIDNEEVVETAIINQVASNGYTQNFYASDTAAPLPAAKLAETLLPDDYECSTPERDMSIARAIVRELDETVMDIFDVIELLSNPVELGAIMTDSVPVVSVGGDAAEVGNWLQENIQDHYQAAYIQSVEDEIACAIFCFLQTDCDLSLDDIISIYEGLDAPTPPTDMNDIEAVIDWILALSLALSTTGIVAVFHLIALYLMRFGGKVSTLLGLNSLKTTIASAQANQDFSYADLCTDCPDEQIPDTYWYMNLDFNISKFDCFPPTAAQITPVIEWTGDGWMSTTNNSGNARTFARKSLGSTAVRIAGIRMHAQIRGSNGNGTYDTFVVQGYPNSDLTGTSQAIFGQSFNSLDGNDVVKHDLTYVAGAANTKSLNFIVGVSGAQAYPTNFAKLTRVEVWGFNQGDDYKPSGSVWVADRV